MAGWDSHSLPASRFTDSAPCSKPGCGHHRAVDERPWTWSGPQFSLRQQLSRPARVPEIQAECCGANQAIGFPTWADSSYGIPDIACSRARQITPDVRQAAWRPRPAQKVLLVLWGRRLEQDAS